MTESNLRRLQREQFDSYHFYDSKIPFIEQYINQQAHLAVTPISCRKSDFIPRTDSSGKSKRAHMMKDKDGCLSIVTKYLLKT